MHNATRFRMHWGLKVFIFCVAISLLQPRQVEATSWPKKILITSSVCALVITALAGFRFHDRFTKHQREIQLKQRSEHVWKGFQRLDQGRLSPLWSQEYSGADLSRR